MSYYAKQHKFDDLLDAAAALIDQLHTAAWLKWEGPPLPDELLGTGLDYEQTFKCEDMPANRRVAYALLRAGIAQGIALVRNGRLGPQTKAEVERIEAEMKVDGH